MPDFDMKAYLAEWLAEEKARKVNQATVPDPSYSDVALDALIRRWETKQTEATEMPNVLCALRQRQPIEGLNRREIVVHLSRMLPIHAYILATPEADLGHNVGIATAAATLMRWGALDGQGKVSEYGRALLEAWEGQSESPHSSPRRA